jgi:hypothetical protein
MLTAVAAQKPVEYEDEEIRTNMLYSSIWIYCVYGVE